MTAMACATTPFKPGDRVIWVRSPGRSILEAWKVERIPGVVVSICRRRVKITVRLGETEKLAIVDPENLIGDDGNGELFPRKDESA
jgi:hypothetical protein